MTTPGDDDALNWSGDDDPTLQPSPRRDTRGTTPVGAAEPDSMPAAASGGPDVEPDLNAEPHADAEPDGAPEDDGRQLSSAALVALGLFGGVYLLYTLGWLIGGARLQGVARFLVADAAFVPFLWVAVAAPALWFGATHLLTRTARTWVRFAWLVGGALLLVPWPLLMIGVAA